MRLFTFSVFFPTNIIAAPQLICRLSSLDCKALLLGGTDHSAVRSFTPDLSTPKMLNIILNF